MAGDLTNALLAAIAIELGYIVLRDALPPAWRALAPRHRAKRLMRWLRSLRR